MVRELLSRGGWGRGGTEAPAQQQRRLLAKACRHKAPEDDARERRRVQRDKSGACWARELSLHPPTGHTRSRCADSGAGKGQLAATAASPCQKAN